MRVLVFILAFAFSSCGVLSQCDSTADVLHDAYLFACSLWSDTTNTQARVALARMCDAQIDLVNACTVPPERFEEKQAILADLRKVRNKLRERM